MAIIKCKMCGGDLALIEGQSVAECEYCGSRQTVPTADNEKKLNLFASANKLRSACEFDRAAGIYDAIKAEFPSEAEAYWGLVLCKYGIEYVNDPATGRKVPTCHRSSYDSVMDDTNLDLAMEYADAVARKVYREEAKHLEKIRTGILEVSSQEKPYDIFICYKETDENGDRTLDSVLAQDIYSALTDKGYRVFFSRITLQSKLGEAYEPYIFAALNSAKAMLAIGTDPEYYNAVWVKNEWSRYLKICAADKTKHLIPCYKGLDAYDMPKEFRPLQGVDLGKMGAVQDILFNMEKYIPLKKQNTTVIHERVVVGGSGGNNKIASLLDRGNMALEDGDWNKAISFFEDVLGNDSRNAQAYIGETLAQEKCRTMDALVRKRRDLYQTAILETLYIPVRQSHIDEMADRYALAGYVEKGIIEKLYDFHRDYSSEVSNRKKQYREEELWWVNHKLLSRAEKFASGSVAEYLQKEKGHLFAQLGDRVKKAQEADARSVAKLEAAYDAHIAEADKQAEKLYNDGLARREKDYRNWLEQAKKENDPNALKKLAQSFAGLGDYQDSRNLAEHCRKRASEEQAKIDAENERQRVIAEQKRKAQQKKIKTVSIVAAAAIVLVAAVSILVTKVIIPGNAYKEAETLLANGQYEEAIAAFEALGDFQDNTERIAECEAAIEAIELAELEEKYNAAVALMNEGKYEEAIAAFNALAGYKDSVALIEGSNAAIEELQLKAQYDAAVALEENGETAKAAIAFGKLAGYTDARERSFALWDEVAVRETLCAGNSHTVALKNDGTVVATGKNNYGQCDVSGWKDIIAISAGRGHTVGLKSDGTVLAIGYDEGGRLAVDGWTDIVAISARGTHTVGLKCDGTVVVAGYNGDGRCDVEEWQDVIAIDAGTYHTIGLKVDGTVLAVGSNEYHQCEVGSWSNIIAISGGESLTIGIRSNGTAIVTKKARGYADNGKHDVGDWNNIVAICAGSGFNLGVQANGKVVSVGEINQDMSGTSKWSNIVAASVNFYHVVGLRADGTVVATGSNEDGRCDVSSWTNIKLP